MSALEARKQEIKKKRLRQEADLRDAPFRPKINRVSRMVAKSKTPAELSDNHAREHKLAIRREAKQARELDGCSFKPKINSNYGHVSGHYSDKTRIAEKVEDWERRKRQRSELARLESERKELDECHFQPQITGQNGRGGSRERRSRSPLRDTQNRQMLANIKGLSRFLENKEKGLRKKEEKRQAYEEAFKWGTNYAGGETRPEPFELRTQKRGRPRRERELREEMERREMGMFKPITKNLIYQEVIQRIDKLDQSSDH